MRVQVELTESEKALPPKQLVSEAIDPELDEYGKWLEKQDGKGSLAPFERELLRSYLWFKTR